MSLEHDLARYDAAAHAVQSGTATELEYRDHGSTKHLRTGIDTTKAEIGGLVTLLIAKGVFTHEEYVAALADAMEREQAALEKRISAHFGTTVHLG